MVEPIAQRIPRALAALIALALLGIGCTTTGPSVASGNGYTPRFASVVCPGRVTASATREMKCGYLTVPEDRSNPSGPQVRVFVIRIEPTGPTDAPPVIYTGAHLGFAFDFIDLPAMADHLDGPEVIAIEPRGTGYSEPNLSCPEVTAIGPRTLAAPIDDPHLRSSFLNAVRACHDRFTSQGIDLSAFNVEEAGADVIDTVRTLGITRWDVVTKGSTSRILFAAMRMHPAGLRSVVAYNPEFPDTDPFAQAIGATRAAVSQLATLCEMESSCAARFPDLGASFETAIRRFEAHPLAVRIGGGDVVVDGDRLLRDLRNLFGTVAADERMYLHLPATIDALAHAKDPTKSVIAVVSLEVRAPTFCTGYLPGCAGDLSLGAYYSALCTDIEPFADVSSLRSLAGGATAWTNDYVDSPYRDVCRAWKVTTADDSVTTPLESDVPMLVFAGGLDPIVAPDAVRKGIAGDPHSFLVVIPVLSEAVVGNPACPDEQPRNQFLADPTSAPETSCQQGFHPRFLPSPL